MQIRVSATPCNRILFHQRIKNISMMGSDVENGDVANNGCVLDDVAKPALTIGARCYIMHKRKLNFLVCIGSEVSHR
jgi:hypothetical protein